MQLFNTFNPYEIVPSRDENGHGSNLAAVAGSILGNGMVYMGVAPEADIVVVKLKECKPSPYTTLSEPAMASDVISVSTYDGITRSFYIESGREFTRTGEKQPEATM